VRPDVEAIDARLPQHQCGRCGYAGCRPYAEAIAAGTAEINRCPPGGNLVITRLARYLGREPLPLDPACGGIEPARVARIDPRRCIGCTKCLPACPVDAIVGAAKRLHEVIAVECTGCGLCVAPCPLDCIRLEPIETPAAARRRLDPPPALRREAGRRLERQAEILRQRYHRHRRRLAGRRRRQRHGLDTADAGNLAARRAEIAAALARVKARRARR